MDPVGPKNSVHLGEHPVERIGVGDSDLQTPKHKLKVCQRGDWLAFRGPWYLGKTEPNQKTFSTFLLSLSFYTF